MATVGFFDFNFLTFYYDILIRMKTEMDKANQELCAYISGIPPHEIWEYIKPSLNPQTVDGIENLYFWVGEYLKNQNKGKKNPVHTAGLTEDFQHHIEAKATFWLIQNNLLFQAEKYLRQEAATMRIPYPWESWTELSKHLVWEEFISLVYSDSIDYFESLPARSFNESLQTEIQYLKNESEKLNDSKSQKKYEASTQKVENQKSKIKNSKDQDLTKQIMFWTCFCEYVFKKHKKKLSGFGPWVESHKKMRLPHKYALIDGELRIYPGRKSRRESPLTKA